MVVEIVVGTRRVDPVGLLRLGRRHMVVEPTMLIIGDDEGTLVPHGLGGAQRVIDVGDELLTPALSRDIVTPARQDKHDETRVMPNNDTMRDA
jgi:hypothetical protein